MTVPLVDPLEDGRLEEAPLIFYQEEVDWHAASDRRPFTARQESVRVLLLLDLSEEATDGVGNLL